MKKIYNIVIAVHQLKEVSDLFKNFPIWKYFVRPDPDPHPWFYFIQKTDCELRGKCCIFLISMLTA